MDHQKLYRSKAGYEKMMAHYERSLLKGPVAYDTQFVSTRYGDTHIVVGGNVDGLPVILFHGWNGNASGIGSEIPSLFSSYRVYMPDIIGHTGKSAPHRLPTKGADYAHWTSDILDSLGLEQAFVIGVSGGGWLTLKFCAHYPKRVIKAVAISSDGLSTANTLAVLWWMLPAVIVPNRITLKRFLQFMTSPNGTKSGNSEAFAEMIGLMKNFKTQGNPGLLTDEALSQITVPTLILMGEDERIFIPAKAILRAKQLIPGLVSAEIVPNAGHIIALDQPEYLATKVLAFFQA
ncbi:MAG: alpha/beta hydrolase [Chloroflexota bacterium]